MAETELDRAEKRYAQAKARLLALKNREATKARKLDTRRKIILGGALVDLAMRDSNAAAMIERLVRKLRVEDCVHFTGRIPGEDFARYYAEATVAVIPSLYEGFGMPAGEAMACGVPVISTTGGALPEVVGDAGILVPPGDQKALEEAIVGLLDDPGRCHALGQAGLKRVHEAFTWRHAAEKTVDVYREAIHADR